MVRGAGRLEQEEEQICPLCINELDATEKAWLPCSCGYQLCLFCYDRLKTEFSNRCPNCRVEYDSDFQAGLRRRQERAQQLQLDLAQEEEAADKAAADKEAANRAAAASAAAAERSAPASSKHVQPPPPPPPRAARSPRSPRRDLHIEQEQLWPSLGAAAAQQAHPSGHHNVQQRPQQPQQQPQQPQQAQQHQQQLHGDAGRWRVQGSPPRLAPILPASSQVHAHPGPPIEQEASSSSSADTAATTPQSPATSVVCFRAVAAAPTGMKPAALPSVPSAVAGRCAVVLQRNGDGLGVEPDPEGASLAASLQEAVRAGSLSVKQAAASLASYLRQRQHAVATAAVAAAAGSASSSPARDAQAHAHAHAHNGGSAGSVCSGRFGPSPFHAPAGVLDGLPCSGACSGGHGGSMLRSETSLAACDSTATSASLSHWAPGTASPSTSLPLPMPTQLGGAASWQQQQQQAQHTQQQRSGSPVRDNDKLPLFMRRGSLRPGAALAGGSGANGGGGSGSPCSSGSATSSASGSFPGFPSRSSSPTAELKRMIAPPPGFGPPLGSTGIAALPRFR